MFALKTPKVDGHLQLTPFVRQLTALGFKAGVNIHKLSPKLAQRTHCLLEELMTDGAPLVRNLQRADRSVLCAGAGAFLAPLWVSAWAQGSGVSSLEEEAKAKLAGPRLMTRGGALGIPPAP